MKLTVLGNTGRYLAPLAAGTSYLLEHGDTKVLLDAGYGARQALLDAGVERLDAVWISHFHRDHVLDLPSLHGALGPASATWIPRGEQHRLDALATALVWRRAWSVDSPVVEAEEGETLRIGDIVVTFARTQHSAPSLAARFEVDGRAFVYASDTAPCDGLRRLARGCDLLLMHTLLPTVEPESQHARNHATAQTAGALAAEVGAKRLVLSHRYHESSDGAMREAAGKSFPGVELARDGETLKL